MCRNWAALPDSMSGLPWFFWKFRRYKKTPRILFLSIHHPRNKLRWTNLFSFHQHPVYARKNKGTGKSNGKTPDFKAVGLFKSMVSESLSWERSFSTPITRTLRFSDSKHHSEKSKLQTRETMALSQSKIQWHTHTPTHWRQTDSTEADNIRTHCKRQNEVNFLFTPILPPPLVLS